MYQRKQGNRVYGTWAKARTCGLPARAHLWGLLGIAILETKILKDYREVQFQSELPGLQGKESSAKLSWKEFPYLLMQCPLILCMATEERGGKASKKLWFINVLSALSHVGFLFCFFPSASLVIMDVTVQEHNLTCLFDFFKLP